MVSEKVNSSKSKSCELVADDYQWNRFWYNLKSYIHPTWLIELNNCSSGKVLIYPNSSNLLWNMSYPLLCHTFNLSLLEEERKLSDSFWMKYIPHLVQYPTDNIRAAGISYFADEKISFTHNEFSHLPYCRDLIQLGRSLSLASRCQLVNDQENKSIEFVGLYFLYHALKSNYYSYWLRIRLAFDREMVLNTEKIEVSHLFSDSTVRSFQRLWKMIHHLEIK